MGMVNKSQICRILIIDDNKNIFKDFQTILLEDTTSLELDALAADFFGENIDKNNSKNIYKLDYVSQGQEGVKKAKKALLEKRPYALAFIDMRMPPGWDGLETIEHLWKVDPNVQVVICTAYSDYSWEEITERIGKTDKMLILKKPFDTAEVAQLASALTEKWHLSHQASLKMNEIEQMVERRTNELAKTNEKLQQEIMERKRTEEALRISNKKILEQQKSVIEEERLKILLQMADATASELNQPLMNLLGNIALIKSDKGNPDKMAKNIGEIEKLGQQISSIVEKIQTIHYDTPHPYQTESPLIHIEQKITILSVEDSDVDFETYKAMLKRSDQIQLKRGKSIEDAMQVMQTQQIDLILLDYMLPDGNGMDFLRLMNKRGFEIPVVVITGQGDEMIASQIIQAGAYDYLPKDKTSVKALSRIIVNTLEKARMKKEIKEAHKLLTVMSTIDELTELYNRRYFEEAFEREVSRAMRYKTDLVLCITDIDHFKSINDTYSHIAGDMVLSNVGKMLKDYFRTSDIICRYGGEEFAIILPNTRLKNAVKACEKFRKVLAKQTFEYESSRLNITISIGVATFSDSILKTYKELLIMADKALYQAKTSGRNRVVVYSKNN